MEYLALMEDRWIGGGGMSPNSRDLNPLPRADINQFPNAKCKQAWHICQFFSSFCQVNKIAKSKCQTAG